MAISHRARRVNTGRNFLIPRLRFLVERRSASHLVPSPPKSIARQVKRKRDVTQLILGERVGRGGAARAIRPSPGPERPTSPTRRGEESVAPQRRHKNTLFAASRLCIVSRRESRCPRLLRVRQKVKPIAYSPLSGKNDRNERLEPSQAVCADAIQKKSSQKVESAPPYRDHG